MCAWMFSKLIDPHLFLRSISSLDSATRRTRIYNTALDLRRQMLKLYVLLRWSKGSHHMQHLKNIIGLIHEQSYQTVDAREHLAETRTILPNARERNHDVVTAIDVLSSGEPHRALPSSIQDEAVGPQSISDAEARQLIRELDSAIRVRLACSEILPLPFQSNTAYEVSEGRVNLRAKDLFSIALTLSGDKEDDRWYLLSVVFDYKVTGPGAAKFPRDLWEGQREGFIATANEILAPKPIQEVEGEEGSGQGGAQPAADGAPIVRLYDFLASQALEYQLDILAYQASEISRLHGRETLSWHWEERCLVLKYWNDERQATKKHQQRRWNPLQGGVVKMQVVPREETSAKERLIRALNLQSQRSGHEDQVGAIGAGDDGLQQREKTLVLQQTWDVDEQLRGKDAGRAKTALVDAQDLNLDTILQRTTARHAELAMAVLEERVRSNANYPVQRIEGGGRQNGVVLNITLHPALSVALSLDPQRGKLSLEETKAAQSTGDGNASRRIAPLLSLSSLSSALRDATTSLNASPDSLIETLGRLRTLAIRDDLQRKSSYVGLTAIRRLNLNQEEYGKIGGQSSQLVYWPLQQSPTWYLLVLIKPDGLKAGVLCATPSQYASGGANTALVIQSLQWIEMERLLGVGGDTKAAPALKRKRGSSVDGRIDANPASSALSIITTEQLARLYSYTTAMTLTAQVEGQLRMRGTPFVYVPLSPASFSTQAASSRAEDAIPPISLQVTHLFGPAASQVLCANALLKIKEHWNPSTSYVRLMAKLKFDVPSGASAERYARVSDDDATGTAVTLDCKRGSLTFQTRSITQALDVFTYSWIPIARVVSLANLLASASPVSSSASLLAFDLRSVTFRYGQRYRCTVKWDSGLKVFQGGPTPGYLLSFATEKGAATTAADEGKCPHSLVRKHLERLLNANASSLALPAWPSFLTILDRTLAILETLVPMHENALDDPASPDVDFLSSTWFRIIWREKFRLDCRLIKGGSACVLYDAAVPLFDRRDEGQETAAQSTIPPTEAAVEEQKPIALDPPADSVTAPTQQADDGGVDSFLNFDDDVKSTTSKTAEGNQSNMGDNDSDGAGDGDFGDDADEGDGQVSRIPDLSAIFRQVSEEVQTSSSKSEGGAKDRAPSLTLLTFDEAVLCDLSSPVSCGAVGPLLRSIIQRVTERIQAKRKPYEGASSST